jgi:hypothetical protein
MTNKATVPTPSQFNSAASLGVNKVLTKSDTAASGRIRANVNRNRNLRGAKDVHINGGPPNIPVNPNPGKPPR